MQSKRPSYALQLCSFLWPTAARVLILVNLTSCLHFRAQAVCRCSRGVRLQALSSLTSPPPSPSSSRRRPSGKSFCSNHTLRPIRFVYMLQRQRSSDKFVIWMLDPDKSCIRMIKTVWLINDFDIKWPLKSELDSRLDFLRIFGQVF